MKPSSSELLFEIGVEEIPSGYFQAAEAAILSEARTLLAECGLRYDRLKVHATPRRFVLHATCVQPVPLQEEEKLGPLKDQAYQNGQATPALLGFLKNVNRKESEVYFKPTPRGERVSVKMKRKKKPLGYFFETLPARLEFPKMMRWEKTRYLFSRPIRWTFAFVGREEQKFKIADVTSRPFSYGHRFLSPAKILLRSADFKAFERLLQKHHVILNAEERSETIRRFVNRFRNTDEELIRTVAYLVEEPFPILGTFQKKYLKLPSAVLTTCMRKHQKIFACYDSSGKLTPQFVAVINGPRKSVKEIARHYETVLTSRLEDAEFFFKEDRKTKLEAKVESLGEMIFLGSLGSYLDKAKRLRALVEFVGREAGLGHNTIRSGSRAAYLAKADLTTHLVYEFPELQGIAGSEYACLDGEEPGVAGAIAGHYLPANLSEDFEGLKQRLNLEGALVGLCDRMDLVVGASGLGIALTGSEDPYALRRTAGSIVKILRARPLTCSLSSWIQKTRELYGNLISKSHSEIERELKPFFKERIVFELELKPGTREYEILQGIFATDFDDIANVYEKFHHLSSELGSRSFLRACKVMERTGNILKGVQDKNNDPIEPLLFQEAFEHRLFELVKREEASLDKLIQEKRYGAAVNRYGDLFYQPVHDFFDHVLVNAEDTKIRRNRQSLVKKINLLCAGRIADLSFVTNVEIPEAQETKV